MSIHNHDQILGAIKQGFLGLLTWASSVGVSMVAFDEWLGRITGSPDVQAVLDSYGSAASKVLSDYAAMYQAILTIDPNTKVPAPDLTVFVPNPDGTVTYVAPPTPEEDPTSED